MMKREIKYLFVLLKKLPQIRVIFGAIIDESTGQVIDDLTEASAQIGKRVASKVASGTSRASSTVRGGAASLVSESVAGPLHPNNLKMAALGLSLGGLGAGYTYGRSRKRRR